MKKILSLVLLPLLLGSAEANEYFVGPAGDDASPGTNAAAPFLTIQHGVEIAKGGDTVTVLDGVYRESVKIRHSGDKDAPIIIRSQNHWGAKVIAIGDPQNAFTIGGAEAPGICYITIKDFDLNAPATYGCGVASSDKAHHLEVDGCYAHDCGSSGIQLNDGDYRIARNNVCARNGLLMPYCGSGISFYGLIKFDDAPGYHAIISGNVCYANDNGPTTKMTDGNGITTDDFRDTQEYHTTKPPTDIHYSGADSLVEGNLTFNNGGRGIHVYLCNGVKVVNNTSVHNMTRANQKVECGEITVTCSDGVVVANNIGVTATVPVDYAGKPNASYLILSLPGNDYAANISFLNNLAFDTANPAAAPVNATAMPADFAASNGNLANTDPKLLKADAPEATKTDLPPDTDFDSYFGLQKDSPAAGAGKKVDGTDFTGTVVDMGMYQQNSTH